MRGFFVGTIALIILYAVLQDRATGAVQAGSNVAIAAMRRLLSPDVAGVPQRRSATVAATTSPGTTPGAKIVGQGTGPLVGR